MTFLGRSHGRLVHLRRVRVLADHLAPLFPRQSLVLDVGCGDTLLAGRILDLRPDIRIFGVEVSIREHGNVPLIRFDGTRLPLQTRSLTAVMLIDVLHHTESPERLLEESKRVAAGTLVIKDHLLRGFAARARLQFMDWVGNAAHGVPLRFNYWPETKWRSVFEQLGLKITDWREDLGLYPRPADRVFGAGLHFIARLNCR